MDHSSNYSSSSGDEASSMAPNNSGRSRAPKPQLDMSAAINIEQKFQLQRIIVALVDDMETLVLENFDRLAPFQVDANNGITPPKAMCCTIPNPNSEKYRHMYVNTDTNKANDPEANKENSTSPSENTTAMQKHKWTIPKSPEEAQKMWGKSDQEILVSSLSELRKDTVAHFSKWRGHVFKRMGDIVIKNYGTTGIAGGQVAQPQPQAWTAGNARRHGNAAQRRASQSSAAASTPGETPVSGLLRLYAPMPTPLKEGPKEKRFLILHSMLLILLGMDQYSLFSRILLVKLAGSLGIPRVVLLSDELRVSRALSGIIKGIPAEEIARRRAEEAKSSRRAWRPGMATAVSSASENDGSLSGPFSVHGIGQVFGGVGHTDTATVSLLGPVNESTVVVGTLFGLYGARQGCKTMNMYGRDIGDFGMLPVHGLGKSEFIDPKDVPPDDRRMRVTIGVSGLVKSQDDFVSNWSFLGHYTEAYTMRWEGEALAKMTRSLETLVKSPSWNAVKEEMSSRTVFDRLTHAYWPNGLIKASKMIENPWCIAMVRAEKAGAVLADILTNRMYGERPISLIGYSLGSRVIYACLMALAEKRAFGIVENVIFIGAPCPTEIRVWAAMKSVVAGRLVNVYSKQDYLLGFLYRNSSWHYGVAGLQKIEGLKHIENLDLSHAVTNHLQYRYLIGSILNKVCWEDVNPHQVIIHQDQLREYNEEIGEGEQDDDMNLTQADQKENQPPRWGNVRGTTGKTNGAKQGGK